MRRNDVTILGSVLAVALIAVFWVAVVGPKRDEAASLNHDVSQLRTQLDEAQASARAGQQARSHFGASYHRLVVLGKAVPADGDQASLLVQIQRLADRSGVGFQSIDVAESSAASAASAPTTPPLLQPGTPQPAPSSTPSAQGAAPTPVAEPTTPPATEAAAAMLPLGASVGPAGLPVMPYNLKFTGGFFEIADFLQRLDGLVHIRDGHSRVDGRLLTVDGFNLAPMVDVSQSGGGLASAVPKLTATLAVTTYLTPAEQGLTAGASPTGPAPTSSTSAPVSSTTTTPTTPPPAATASVPTP